MLLGEKEIENLYDNLKRICEKNNYPFEITYEEYLKLWKTKCSCGETMSFPMTKDSDEGYLKKNLYSTCRKCYNERTEA